MDVVALAGADLVRVRHLINRHTDMVGDKGYEDAAFDWLSRGTESGQFVCLAAGVGDKLDAYAVLCVSDDYKGASLQILQACSTNSDAANKVTEYVYTTAISYGCNRIIGVTKIPDVFFAHAAYMPGTEQYTSGTSVGIWLPSVQNSDKGEQNG